jgi:hypothetical protein
MAPLLIALLVHGVRPVPDAHGWCGASYPAMGAEKILDTITGGKPSSGPLHLVRWDLQASAKARLEKVPMIRLDRNEAAALLGPGDRLVTSGPILLVRAGLFAGADSDGGYGTILQARYGAETRTLLLEGYQLTSAEPSYRKIAVFLEFAEPVDRLAVWCTADR